MTRMSKKEERRSQSPRRRRIRGKKTGPQKDKLALGYKAHENAYQGKANIFIPKIA